MTSNNESFRLDPKALPEVGDASRYVGTQRSFYKATLARGESATDRAAYATFLGEHVLKVIFQPRGTEGAMTGEMWAETFGKSSKSLTTGWRRLGHVLMVVGLDPDGDTYKRLRNSNAYALGDVGEAMMADNATEESILAAMAPFVDEHGKRIIKRNPVVPTGETNDDNKQDEGEAVPVSVQFLAAITLIEKVCGDPDISLDEWAAGADRLTEAITKGNTLRAHAAATPKATPATVKVAKGKGAKAS